jgi:hypothetical protein
MAGEGRVMADDYDPMLDCYRSWAAYIELCRKRLEDTGEYPHTGPWAKPELPLSDAGHEQ